MRDKSLAWQAGRLYSRMSWWQRVLFFAAIAFCIYEVFHVSDEDMERNRVRAAQLAAESSARSQAQAKAAAEFKSKSDALYLCQTAMRSIAKDPEKAEIPYVDVFDGKDVWMVAWGASTKMMRMRNGLGLEVVASGSCDVNKINGKLVSLTLNGKQLLKTN